MNSSPAHRPILRMQDISKQYPGVRALGGVSFDLRRGEVHCLVGENGAGKSTLMKILSGAVQPDGGEIVLDGVPITFPTPSSAQEQGISTIYQEVPLIPDLNVAENILLGNEPTTFAPFVLDKRRLHERARNILSQLGEEIDTHEIIRDLNTAHRQIVEIAKALSRRARILVMDEPTSSLTRKEIERLFAVIRRLKSEGISVIYISHRLDEVFEIGDRASVLRDGVNVVTSSVAGLTRPQLIRWMVGRELEREFPDQDFNREDLILRLDNVTTPFLKGVSLTLHRGEILGLGGLVGAGRTEIARVLFGAEPILEGSIEFLGKPYRPQSPADAIGSGVGLLTEDRNNQGLFLELNVRENISIANLQNASRASFIIKSRERDATSELVEELHIKTPSSETAVDTLSGGNRQKVVLGRWLYTNSTLLLFDEPTVGIDVGAKEEIYQRINGLARSGVGIIIISSDMTELLGLCTRIAVLCDGRITGILKREEATQERILSLATQFASSISAP